MIGYFDAFSGMSGDMTIGALVDAGAPFPDLVRGLESLATGAAFRLERVKRKGIAAAKFHVDYEPQRQHRHLHHILAMIDKADLPVPAKQSATAAFQILGEAEAEVHGISLEKVHFHEVGAVDSICDIVGACLAIHLLGIESVYCSPMNVGSGTVNTEHGVLPVPTPATARLLTGKPVYSSGPTTELVTPTGAALAVSLSKAFGPMPAMEIAATGYGAGDKDFPIQANVLRFTRGRASKATEATSVAVLEANIDDCSAQVLGYAMERLLAAGALDVTLQPLQMKKNRPGTLLRVIATPESQEHLANLIFKETPTLGLRVLRADRRVQAREIVEVQTEFGCVRMKVTGDTYAPEYEDCRLLAESSGIPLRQIIAEANAEYLRNR